MEQEAMHLKKMPSLKVLFMKIKYPLIVMKYIFKRQCYPIRSYMVKIHLNTLLDMDIKVKLLHHHCV